MNGWEVFVELIVKTAEPRARRRTANPGPEAVLKSLPHQPIGVREAQRRRRPMSAALC